MKKIIFISAICIGYAITVIIGGCAQISAPTGGAKDTIPPRLMKATPEMNSVNFRGNKISFSFNEYIDIQNIQSNLVVSPLQKTNPVISAGLRSFSIKFKDSLLPNTTYTLNFGDAIVDIHESNVLKNFTYVFSTGSFIDSLTLEGRVTLAESGKADSTITVMLYRNIADSAVLKTKPDYIAKPNGQGDFVFSNLPASDFNVYALKDGDGGKTYNSKTEIFAFRDSLVNSSRAKAPIILYAYAEQKPDNNKPPGLKPAVEKKLKFNIEQTANTQDLLQTLDISFNNPLQKFDIQKLLLSDTNYKAFNNYTVTLDSTRKKVSIKTVWLPGSFYYLVLPKEIAEDSTGNMLQKTDTIKFTTKKTADYGSLVLRFTNLNLEKHPVIQFFEGDNLKFAFPILSAEWSNKLFAPGEYSVRILYDQNNNGKWDPGNYMQKLQPEKAIELPQKLSIRADWENERDIRL